MAFLMKRSDVDIPWFPMPDGTIRITATLYCHLRAGQHVTVELPFWRTGERKIANVFIPAGSGDGIYRVQCINPGLIRIQTQNGKALQYRPRGKRWGGKEWVKHEN